MLSQQASLLLFFPDVRFLLEPSQQPTVPTHFAVWNHHVECMGNHHLQFSCLIVKYVCRASSTPTLDILFHLKGYKRIEADSPIHPYPLPLFWAFFHQSLVCFSCLNYLNFKEEEWRVWGTSIHKVGVLRYSLYSLNEELFVNFLKLSLKSVVGSYFFDSEF